MTEHHPRPPARRADAVRSADTTLLRSDIGPGHIGASRVLGVKYRLVTCPARGETRLLQLEVTRRHAENCSLVDHRRVRVQHNGRIALTSTPAAPHYCHRACKTVLPHFW